MSYKVKNNVFAELALDAPATATQLTLVAGQGVRFPILGVDDWCYATLQNPANQKEIVRVTLVDGDVLTCVRGVDDTVARDFVAGDRIDMRPVAALFNEYSSSVTGALNAAAAAQAASDAAANKADSATVTANNAISVATDANNQVVGISYDMNHIIDTTNTNTQNYAYSRVDVDGKMSSQYTQITSEYTTYTDSAKASAISTASADVRTYAYSKADVDSADAGVTTTLRSEYTTGDNNTLSSAQSYVQTYSYSKAGTDSAISGQINTVNSRLDNAGGTGVTVEQKLTSSANAITGLQGQWSVKIQSGSDANPVIAGIDLSTTSPVAGAGTSDLTFLANKFKFVLADSSHGVPFAISGTRIQFNGDVLINGSLALGPGGLQPGFEAPGTLNTQAMFNACETWEFKNTTDGWSAGNATLTPGTDSVALVATAADMQISRTVSIAGASYSKVRVRLKRTGGSTWDGKLYYQTAGHGFSESYVAVIPDTTTTTGYTVLEWNMAAVSDWTSNTITALRLDFGTTATDAFDIDSICYGKYGPPPSQSSVDAAATAAADRLSKSARNVLSGGAGLAVGSLTWDNTGARTGGYGLGMNAYGLVGYRSDGTATLTYNASTGDLAVKGDLSGSTGTFGAVTIGSSASFGQSAYDTGNGGWIQGGASPKFSMRSASGKYLRIDVASNVFDFNGVSMSGATINSPTITTPVITGLSLAQITDASYTLTSSAFTTVKTATATPSNAQGTVTYNWNWDYADPNAVDVNFTVTFNADKSVATIQAQTSLSGVTSTMNFNVTAIDGNSLSASRSFSVTVSR